MTKTKVHRKFYKAQLPNSTKDTNLTRLVESYKNRLSNYISDNRILTISIFKWKSSLFLYMETTEDNLSPNDFFMPENNSLLLWPSNSQNIYWLEMMNVFNYYTPTTFDDWKRPTKEIEPIGWLQYLRPEKVSSYIFYHFQLQEEEHDVYDKFGTMSITDNLLFFYHEKPHIILPKKHTGILATHNSITDGPEWQKIMEEHFIPWEGEPKIWISIKNILYV